MHSFLDRCAPSLIAIGRILLASLFILGGVNKLLNYQETLVFMEKGGLEPAAFLLPLTILLELGGGLTLAIGKRFASISGVALAVFTIATNVVFHRFWTMEGAEATLQLSLFFKNVSVAGALLFAAGVLARKHKM
jgi:putative oxidoreductase